MSGKHEHWLPVEGRITTANPTGAWVAGTGRAEALPDTMPEGKAAAVNKAVNENQAPLGLRTVALFEFAKGTLVFLVGLGAFSLIHQNVEASVEELLRTLHLDPAWHYAHMLVEATSKLNDHSLRLLGFAAMAYAIIRYVEAYGLWHSRAWAEWFAVVSASLYVPVEIYHLSKGLNWARVAVFVGNIIIVLYLAHLLRIKHRQKHPKPD